MSDHNDAVAEGVLLLKTIGLDITYTDEGLEVIVRQIMRLGRAEAREAVAAVPDAVDETGGYSFDEAITMALAAIDAPCDCGTCRAIAADRLTRGKEG